MSNLKSVALTVLELFAFNARFKLVRLTVPLCTHRHRNTHIEQTHYLRHSLPSLCGDNNNWKDKKTNEEILRMVQEDRKILNTIWY